MTLNYIGEGIMNGRRKFLSILGGGVVLAATGVSVWATTRDPMRAREPWQHAGVLDEADPRRRALSYAVLAPNPHNRQPWVAELSVDGEITLFCDLDRRLPHTDPCDRQITIGLGCFLELLAQAAAQQGWRTDISVFPDGEPQPRLDERPVARVRFVRDPTTPSEPLFAHVLSRRSNKELYDISKQVSSESLATISAAARTYAVGHTNDPARVGELRTRAWAAMETELTTYSTMKESVELMRIGRAEIEANPDGIDLSGPFIEGLATFGLLRRHDLLDPNSSAFRQQIPVIKAPFDTAMAFIWLTTPGNSRHQQIGAGRDYVRLNLAATGLGISMHPLSQSLQEFDEMRLHFSSMRKTLGIAAHETLQMFVRLGYAPHVKGAPRWPYQTRIRNA
jgi:hypothetical protein